jgi:hypothetical protein
VPLPTRWKIVFHPPIRLGAPREAVTDQAYCSSVARSIQGIVQRTLDREASLRPLGKVSGLVSALAPGPVPAEPEDPLEEPPRPPIAPPKP